MNANVQKKPSPHGTQCSSSMESAPSPAAACRAAVILEVLAGQRTATEAADALRVSINHYYLLEKKALRGLTAACEIQPKGPRGPGLEEQIKAVQRELEQCQRECLRQTALVRATQRALGLSASAVKAPKKTAKNGKQSGRKTRRRRPQVRALRAASEVRKNCSGQEQAGEISKTISTTETAGGTEPTAIPAPVKESSNEAQG